MTIRHMTKYSFLLNLELALKFTGKRPIVIISDNTEYIRSAIEELFGNSVKHINTA